LHDTSQNCWHPHPVDIAFAGFNNDPISKVVEPNLTTINYSGYHIGEVAVMNLINHLRFNQRKEH
jgi:LacI family transcriptional regulator